jgi:hypothetical protein
MVPCSDLTHMSVCTRRYLLPVFRVMCIPGTVVNVWEDFLSETCTGTGITILPDMVLNIRLVVQGTASGDTGPFLHYACPQR